MRKRLISLLLACTMVLSFVYVPSFAVEKAELTVLSIDKLGEDGEVIEGETNVTELVLNDIIAVTVGVKAGSESIAANAYQFKLNYDSDVFELWSQSASKRNNFHNTSFSNLVIVSAAQNWPEPAENVAEGSVTLAASNTKKVQDDYTALNATANANESIDLIQIAFKVKATAESGRAVFSFNAEYENRVSYFYEANNEKTKPLDLVCTPVSLTILGNPPELDYVEVTDATGNVLAYSKSETEKYPDEKRAGEVKLDSETSYTYFVKAYSKKGTDITDQVQWSISHDPTKTVGAQLDETDKENKIVKVTIPEKGGRPNGVTLSEITAKMPEAETSKTAKILYRRADSIPTSANISLREGSSASLQVPGTDAADVTAQFDAVVYDQFGEDITRTALGSSCYWYVESANAGSTSTSGISMNYSTGLLTVKSNALNTVQNGNTSYTVYIQASGGRRVGTYPITVSLSDRVPTSIEITGGASTLAVPKTDTAATATYTATVKDQYGTKIEGANVTWELTNDAAGSTVVTRAGVSIENGVLTVTKAAAGNDFIASSDPAKPNTLLRPIYIKATCGNVSCVETLILSREAATVTSLALDGDAEIAVPKSGEKDVEKSYLRVYDQYGIAMNSASIAIEWSKSEAVWKGVTFVNGGIEVSSDAAGNDFNEGKCQFTITAKYHESGRLIAEATKTITLKREPSVATAITYNDTVTTEVPTNEDQVPTNATPAVEDQYGLLMNRATVESDGALPTGIVLKSGELYITKAAVAHFGGERKVQVFVKLKCGESAKNTVKLWLELANAQTNPSSAEISGPTSIAKPTGEQSNTAVYSILNNEIKDQYGLPLTFEPSKLTMKLYSDAACARDVMDGPVTLSKGENGNWIITVTKDATLDKTYYLKASYPVGTYSPMQCAPVKEITIVDKTVSNTLTVTQGNFTYGEEGKLNPVVKKGSEAITNATFVYTKGGQTVTEVKDAGKYTVTATCEDANYIYTGSVDFQILPKEIKVDWIELDGTRYTYNGREQTVQYTVKDGNTTLVKDRDYTVEGDKQTNAGVHLLKIIGNGNYTSDPTDESSVNWDIWELPVRINTATFQPRAYAKDNYSAVLDTLTLVTEDGSATPDTMTAENGFTVSDIRVADNNAGQQPVSFKVTLTNTNYKWAVPETGNIFNVPESVGYKVTINKIDHRAEAVSAAGKYGKQLSVDLSQVLPEGWSATASSIDNTNAVLTEIHGGAMYIMEQDGKLWLQLTNDSNKVGKDATVTLTVNSTNYNPFTITVTVTVQNKKTQTVTANDLNVTYGDAGVKLNASALDNAKLTYQVTEGADVVAVDANGNVTLRKSGTAKIQITAVETEDYGTANTTVTVTVAKRSLTVKANDLTAYVGGQLPALDYTVTGLVSGETLTTVPELELKDVPAGVDPMKTAGTYTIGFKTAPVADKDKYDLTVETGTLTVSSRPNVNPVPAGNSVKLEEAAGGKLTSSVSRATKGTTVTITVKPDAGYRLEELEVLDKNGEALPLKELANGKFSFQMPDSKVTVQASFVQESTYAGYPDVLPQDWFYSSVRYVTERSLMNGTPNGFEPNMDSSRATIWTILARFSGVDTTVVSGEWYAVARQWAMENGVSDGTNPNGVITREQLATMLYRFAKNKGLVQEPVTADLSVFVDAGQISDYALDAMRWAVSVGLLNGMDGSRLAPQGSAARAQVAAMLMRFDQLAK